MKAALLEKLIAERAARRPVAVATLLDSGRQWLIAPDGETDAPPAVADAARRALAEDRSQTVEGPEGVLFIQVHNPPLRMIVVGAVHIAQALAPIAARAGFAVTVVDPRGAFATAARFPGVEVSGEWPDDALRKMTPDARTAVITLTHDPKLDDAALAVALNSAAFYIGSLGSAKTHLARTRRLARLGFDAAAIARIHGPIGLPIGARSPAEIAIAILAQVIETRRKVPPPTPAESEAA